MRFQKLQPLVDPARDVGVDGRPHPHRRRRRRVQWRFTSPSYNARSAPPAYARSFSAIPEISEAFCPDDGFRLLELMARAGILPFETHYMLFLPTALQEMCT